MLKRNENKSQANDRTKWEANRKKNSPTKNHAIQSRRKNKMK